MTPFFGSSWDEDVRSSYQENLRLSERLRLAMYEIHSLRTCMADQGIQPPDVVEGLRSAYYAHYQDPKVRQ